MKKSIFSALCLVLLATTTQSAWGAEGTATFGPDWNSLFGTSYTGSISGVTANSLTLTGTIDGVTITIENGKSTNGYVKSGDLRAYNNYTITFSSSNAITSITTIKGGKTFTTGITANVGKGSISNNAYTWTGNANTIVLSIGGTVSFSSITVTYETGSTGTTDYSVHWMVNGQEWKTTTVTEGSTATSPGTPDVPASCNGKVFVGWSATDIGTAPTNDPGKLFTTESPAINADATYYAVFATKNTTGGGAGATHNWTTYSDWGENATSWLRNNNAKLPTFRYTPTYAVAKVVLNVKQSNTKGSNSIEVTIGGSSFGTKVSSLSGKDAYDITFEGATAMSGEIVITCTNTSGSGTGQGTFFLNSITVHESGSTTTYSDYVTQCVDVECTANTLSLTATETTVNLPETGGVDVNIANFVTNVNNTTDAVTYSSDSGVINSSTGAFHANAKGDYVITISQPVGTGDPVICAVSKTFTVHVLATPTITLTAVTPITLTADCGKTTTATVQVTAYNCGNTPVTIALSDNDAYITVSPASFTPNDGKVNDVVTLSYTASTGDAAEKYTATISAKCGSTAGQNTINVTATKGNCTQSILTFIDRGSQYKQINSHYAGQTLQASEVPDPKGVCTQPTNYVFDGWATAKVDNGVTSYEKVDFSSYVINGDQTFYAVYKYAGEGGSGGEEMYYLSETSSGTTYYVGEYIITANSQYLSAVTNISDAIPLGIEDGKYLYTYIAGVKTYISHSSSGESTLASSTKNPKEWTITDNGTTIKLRSTAQTSRYLGYSNGFRAYAKSHTLTKTTAIQYNYTSSPACGPYVRVTAGKDVYVTAGNAGGTRSIVQVQDTVKFVAGALKGSNGNPPSIKIPAADIKIGETTTNKLTCKITQNVTDNGDGTYSISGYIVLKYKPTDFDKTEDIQVQLRAEHNTTNVNLDNFTVHARALPEKFVITAKGTDGKWYALPADMSGSNTQPANGQLVVDNTATPTKATITPCNTIYKFDGQKQGGDLRYVRFVGLNGKYLWAATTGNTGIKNDAKDPAAADAPYNWLLTSADNVTYTFANQNTDRNLRLSGTNFGMYTSGVNELRILPIVEKDTCAYNAAPQNITLVSKTSTTVTLAWAAVPGAERYQYNVGTIWNDCTVDDLDYPQATITGLGTGATVTIALRAVHGTAEKICSDTAQITVTTANCDDVPTISGTINGGSSCGTLTLTATGVTASSDALCPITQYGFQYTQDTTTWATYEQTEHSSLPVSSSINDPVTVSRGGKYYVRLYAVNEVGTGYSAVKTIDVSGLANLQIITAGDATTAPMISGKATLRIGAVSDSPSPITWQVFDGSNAEQTTIAAGIANNGVFSTTAFGVYRVVAKQAADPTYCADSATIYIEVRLPNHYGYVTNCAVLNNNNLEVINVSKDNITFGIDDADVVQIEIVKENTGNTSTGGGGQANDLFISKYFEATGSVKLIAIFNGTNEEIDLSNYTVKIGRVNKDTDKASWAHTLNLSAYGKTTGKIASGEEIILYSQGQYPNCSSSSKADCEITKCVLDNKVFDFNSGYKENVKINFSGVQSVVLCKNEVPIDILGSITNATKDGLPMKVTESPSWGDANGWVGYGPNIDNESEMIPISTNRCLLIRRNTVVDGSKTLTQNINSRFNTLGTYNRSTPSSSIEGEWAGLQIPENDVYNDDGVTASCHGFEFVGSFDYAEYFQRYEPVTGKIDLVPLNQNADGSWSLSTTSFEGTAWEDKNFHDLACTSVKINGYKKSGSKDSLITALNYKVPIIVDRTTTTDDAKLFGFAGDGRIICPECDVVIRDSKKLSVVPAGYNNIRNMWVYSGAALNIQDDKTYNMGKLTIESENNEVGYALIKGTLNAQDGISHTKRIDANAWYDFSLPYNCKVSDIVRTNGKTLGLYSVNAGDLAKNDTARWVIKYYDGQKRANTGTPNGAAPTNWAVVPADGILEAGVGYIVALGGTHNANPNYKVRFVLPNRSTQPYVESVADKRTKGVKGYTGPKAEELPCHKGWNYLGNPYVSRFDGDKQNPSWQTYTGLLLNGFYTDLLTGNSYAEYPDIYVAVDMGEGGVTNWVQTKASGAQLSPFRAFMIQAVSDGDVDFNKEARNIPQNDPITPAPSIRSVSAEREIVNAVRLNISHDTYGTGSTDIMLHSLYTDKYDLGYDMVRMFNSRPAAQPFTLNSTADYLLYNAANRDLAETSDIPVGIRTLAAGTYTFSLAPLTGTDRYAAIYLIDRDENDLKIDLLQGNYTTMLARETNTSRFALRFEKGAQLPTDIDNDAIQSPIIYRDQTDIVIDNLPTDATVRVVDAIGRTLYMQQADAQIVRFHAPARGAYIIQVMTQQGNFSIKTIL